MKKVVGLAITVICVGLFIVFAFVSYRAIRTRQLQAPVSQEVAPKVQTISAQPGRGSRTIPVLATLKSRATIRVMPETAGRIKQLFKREGDVVKTGEVIARIESDELQTQLRMAGAQSNAVSRQTSAAEETIRSLESQKPALIANESYWKAEQERDRTLFEKGALSKAQYEGTVNRYAEAKAKRTALEAQIAASRAQKQAVASQKDAAAQTVALWQVRNRYAEVSAVVDGVISSRLQEEGNYVTPASVLYTLEDTSGSRLLMQVPQQYLDDIAVGMPVRFSDADIWALPEFSITRIHPTGNELRQLLVEAEAAVPLRRALFERQFTAHLIVREAEGLVLPPESFSPLDMTSSSTVSVMAYVVAGTQARRTSLPTLLLTDDGRAVIDAALHPEGVRVLRLPYLQQVRWPETIAIASESVP